MNIKCKKCGENIVVHRPNGDKFIRGRGVLLAAETKSTIIFCKRCKEPNEVVIEIGCKT